MLGFYIKKIYSKVDFSFFVPPAEKFGLKKLALDLSQMSKYVLEKGKKEEYGK